MNIGSLSTEDEFHKEHVMIRILSLSATHGVMHAYLVILPALLPLIKEEIPDYAILGILVSVIFLVYGWGSLPVGIMADRFSKKAIIVSSMLLCGFSSILIGYADGFLSMAVPLMLLGLGTSLYHPSGFAVISLLSKRLRGRFMGIHGLGGNAGMAVGYLASAVLGTLLNWRGTFIIWGVVGLAMGVINFFLIRDLGEGKSHPQSFTPSIKAIFLVKENTLLYSLVFVIIICCGLLWNGVSAFIVSYLKEVKNTELILAGGLATISYLFGSIARIVGGEVSDRIGRGSVLIFGFFTFAIFSFLFTLPAMNIPLLLVLTVSLLGFTFFITQSPLGALIADISPSNVRGLTYGTYFMVKYGIGGITPAVVGVIATTYSMDAIFYFFGVISLLSMVASFILKIRFEKRRLQNSQRRL